VVRDPRLSHRPEVLGGVLAAECAELLRHFFRERR
jgi:tRNA(adenine34) deaminase